MDIPAVIRRLKIKLEDKILELPIVAVDDEHLQYSNLRIALPNDTIGAADLVLPTHPQASSFRVRISEGVRAWRKLIVYYIAVFNGTYKFDGEIKFGGEFSEPILVPQFDGNYKFNGEITFGGI